MRLCLCGAVSVCAGRRGQRGRAAVAAPGAPGTEFCKRRAPCWLSEPLLVAGLEKGLGWCPGEPGGHMWDCWAVTPTPTPEVPAHRSAPHRWLPHSLLGLLCNQLRAFSWFHSKIVILTHYFPSCDSLLFSCGFPYLHFTVLTLIQIEPHRSALSSVCFTQAIGIWSAADIQISSADFSKRPAWFSLPKNWIESVLSFFAFPSLEALADDG